jgi:hypothetical protein
MTRAGDLRARAEAEYRRLAEIARIAQRGGAHDALASTLAAMNAIARVLGYEPGEGHERR